jgi:hypothetical protein
VGTDRAKNEEILHSVNEERNSYIQSKERKLIGLVTFRVGTVF